MHKKPVLDMSLNSETVVVLSFLFYFKSQSVTVLTDEAAQDGGEVSHRVKRLLIHKDGCCRSGGNTHFGFRDVDAESS